MKKREALAILIDNAAKNVGGVGTGIRPEITHENRLRVAEAVQKVWKDVYSWPISRTDFINLNLPDPTP